MNGIAYLRLQLELEGRGLTGEHTLKQTKTVPGEELPLMLLAQLADRRLVVGYSESLSNDLQAQLSACVSSIEFPEVDPIIDILKSNKIQSDIGHYKTCLFPHGIPIDPEVNSLSKHDPQIKAFGFDGFAEQVYTIEREGKVVSACVSVREDQNCGEAWVYTDPEYQRMGLAQKVVNAWAQSLIRLGKVPFYSHKIENIPSARLAKALELQLVFEEITITEIST